MDRKKELKAQYKQMRPDMGLFVYECLPTGKQYIGLSQNMQGKINSITMQLKNNSCVFRNLQADWKQYGAEQFAVRVLEKLEYDEDELKTDYGADLQALADMVTETMDNYELLQMGRKK